MERRPRRERYPLFLGRPGPRILELSGLPLPTLYSIFLNLVTTNPDALKDFKHVFDSVAVQRLSAPVTLDEKSLVVERPEKLVDALARDVARILLKQSDGKAYTEASVYHEASRIASGILVETLMIVLSEYGYF